MTTALAWTGAKEIESGKETRRRPADDAVRFRRLEGGDSRPQQVDELLHVQRIRQAVGQGRRGEQPRQVVAHRARRGDRRQVRGPLHPPLPGDRAGDRDQRQRCDDQHEDPAQRQRQRLAALLQQPRPQPRRQPAAAPRRQGAGQRAARGYPTERPLQHRDAQPPLLQVAHGQCGESAVLAEVCPQQGSGWAQAVVVERLLEQARRQVQDADRVAGDRRRRPRRLDPGRIGRQRQVADLTARGDPASGRWAASLSSRARAAAEATRVGRGDRPSESSTSRLARSGSAPAQASAAAAGRDPSAPPTLVTSSAGSPARSASKALFLSSVKTVTAPAPPASPPPSW